MSGGPVFELFQYLFLFVIPYHLSVEYVHHIICAWFSVLIQSPGVGV